MMPSLISLTQLPDLGWFAIAALIVFALAAWGGSVVLRELRELRTNLANELRREIDTAKEAQPVAVQQPLVVTAHQESVTQSDLTRVDTQLHGRLKRERAEIDARIDRVEQAAAERADSLDRKLDANTTMTAQMSGEVKHINQSVQLILSKLTNP